MNVIIAILIGLVAGCCIREFWPGRRPPADGGPDVDQCVEIIDSCTAALNALPGPGLFPIESYPRKPLEDALAVATARLKGLSESWYYDPQH